MKILLVTLAVLGSTALLGGCRSYAHPTPPPTSGAASTSAGPSAPSGPTAPTPPPAGSGGCGQSGKGCR